MWSSKIFLTIVTFFLLSLSIVYAAPSSRQINEPITFSVGYNFFGVSSRIGLSQTAIEGRGCSLRLWTYPDRPTDYISPVNKLLFFRGTETNIERAANDRADKWIGYLVYNDIACTVPVTTADNEEEVQPALGTISFQHGYNTIIVPTVVDGAKIFEAGCQPRTWKDPVTKNSLGDEFSFFLTFSGTQGKIDRTATSTAQPRVGYLVYVDNPNGCQVQLSIPAPEIRFAQEPTLQIAVGSPVAVNVVAQDIGSGLQKIFIATVADNLMSIVSECVYQQTNIQKTCLLQFKVTKAGRYDIGFGATNAAEQTAVLHRTFTAT